MCALRGWQAATEATCGSPFGVGAEPWRSSSKGQQQQERCHRGQTAPADGEHFTDPCPDIAHNQVIWLLRGMNRKLLGNSSPCPAHLTPFRKDLFPLIADPIADVFAPIAVSSLTIAGPTGGGQAAARKLGGDNWSWRRQPSQRRKKRYPMLRGRLCCAQIGVPYTLADRACAFESCSRA